jgi:lysophospholipase
MPVTSNDMKIMPADRMNRFLPKNSHIDYMVVRDNTRLRFGFFPSVGQTKAIVYLVNGHREFLEKNAEFITNFQNRGLSVYSMDLRGQGLSDRNLDDRMKSHNPDFDKFITDIDEFITLKIKQDTLGLPFYMVGHSLGAHIALHYLHDHPNVVDKAVLLSPFTDLNNKATCSNSVIKLFFKFMNKAGFASSFAPGQAKRRNMINHENAFNKLTHDIVRYNLSQKALASNPKLFVGGVTYGWVNGAIDSLIKFQQKGYMERITTPILCLLSEQEKVVNNATTKKLMKRVPNASVEYIAGARHEIYRETDEIQFALWKKIDNFFNL